MIRGIAVYAFIFSVMLGNQSEISAQESPDEEALYAMTLEDFLKLEIETSSKTPRSSTDVTQKVDVITEAQIDRMVSGNRNIAEFIQYLPGASVKVLSRNDANWGAYGGIGPKYSSYMVQGLPVDAFIDPQGLDIMAVKRIEVQRGPASVLYPNYLSQDFAGNQSPLAGTVNLILKERIERPQTMASLGYGAYNTIAVKAYHQNRIEKLDFFSGISHESSDYTDYGSSESWLNMLDNPEYKKSKLLIGASIHPDSAEKHKITFFGNHVVHNGNLGRTHREFDFKYSLVNIGYGGRLTDDLQLTFKSGLRRYDREYQGDLYDDGLGSYVLQETSGVEQLIVPVDLALNFNHLNDSNLTIGVDYQHASYLTWVTPVDQARETGNDADISHRGVYIQEELQLERFTLRGGGRFNTIRYDIDTIGGQTPGSKKESWEEFLWSVGVKYRVKEAFTLFANAGSSFMPPGLKSVGGTVPLSQRGVPGSNGQLPNPGLEPESGLSVDLGGDYLFPRRNIHLSTRVYYTEISDAIIDNVVSETPSQTMSVNADEETVSKGIEIGINHQIENLADWFANFTYIKSEIIAPDNPDQDNAEVPFVPETMFNMGITFHLPNQIEISPWLHYSGRIYDSSSKTNRNGFASGEQVNLVISKAFDSTGGKKFNVFIKVYNITNNEYDMPWQFRDTGISFSLGSTMVF